MSRSVFHGDGWTGDRWCVYIYTRTHAPLSSAAARSRRSQPMPSSWSVAPHCRHSSPAGAATLWCAVAVERRGRGWVRNKTKRTSLPACLPSIPRSPSQRNATQGDATQREREREREKETHRSGQFSASCPSVPAQTVQGLDLAGLGQNLAVWPTPWQRRQKSVLSRRK